MRSLVLFFALLAVLYVSIRIGEQLLDDPGRDGSDDIIAETDPGTDIGTDIGNTTSPDINRGRGSIIANVTIEAEEAEEVEVVEEVATPTPPDTPATQPQRPHTLVIIKRQPTPLKTRPDTGTGSRTHTTDSALLNALETQTPAVAISNGTAQLNLPQPSPEMPPVDLLVIIDADDPALEEEDTAQQQAQAQTQRQSGTGEVIPPPNRPRFVDPPPERPLRLTTPPSVPLYYVQMASFRDEDRAYQAAALLSEQHKSRLGYVRVGIISFDRGSDGVFWRVVTEEMTREEAIRLCNTLKSSGQDCVLRNLETGEELVRSR
ncbi:MAG: SPOR domain-containing protein [Proteobacteria bacterium]|nr:SPOR domain-containing protein [Pseudomonadota bacterium]